MQTIRVSGNIDDIFSCVDFYQNIAVVGLQSIEELRKVYIDLYLEDYKHRYAYRQRKKEKMRKEAELEREKLRLEEIKRQEEAKRLESKKEPEKQYTKTEEVEGSVQISNQSVRSIFSALKEADAKKAKIESDWSRKYPQAEYVNRGVYLEDFVPTVSPRSSSENTTNVQQVKYRDAEYVSTGVILEEFKSVISQVQDVPSAVVASNKIQKNTSNPVMYVSQGVVLEDVIPKVSVSESSFTSDDIQDLGNSDDSTKVRNSHTKKKVESRKRKKVKRIDTDKTVKDKELSKRETEKTESYKNVRDFVKRNPGCVLNDILRYFSQKEIQRALMSAKVVQRKKKFYVV